MRKRTVGAVSIILASALWPCRANACVGGVSFHGGSVISHPKIYISRWNFNWDPYLTFPMVQAYFGGIGAAQKGVGGSQYLATLAQYGVSNDVGILKGDSYVDTTPFVVNPPSPSEISAAAIRAATYYGVRSNPNAVILIMTDSDRCQVSVGGIDGCNACISWHGSAGNAPYAAMPVIDLTYSADLPACNSTGNPLGYTMFSLSHEVSEALTNPRDTSWYDADDCEISDKCQSQGAWVPLANSGIANWASFHSNANWSNLAGATGGGSGECVIATAGNESTFYTSAGLSLYQSVAVGGAWINRGTPVGQILASSPGATSWGWNRLDVFAVAFTSPTTLAHFYSDNGGTTSGWGSWGSLPSPWYYLSSPDAASWGPGRLDVVSVARQTTVNTIFHRSYDNGTYSAWQQWGGTSVESAAIASPRVTSQQAVYEVHVVARSTSNTITHAVSDGSAVPLFWEQVPTSSTFESNADVDVASWGAIDGKRRLDIVFADASGNVRQLYCYNMTGPLCSSGSTPVTVNRLHPAGVTLTRPTVAQLGDFRLRISARGSDGNVWSMLYDVLAGTWSSWGSGASGPIANGGIDATSW